MKLFYYVLLFIAGIIVQFGWIQFLSPSGISPNFIIIFLLYTGLSRGPLAGEVMGFSWGLAWDVLAVDLFGSHAFLFTCFGYLSGKLSRKWNESKVINQMALTLIATLLFWLGMYLLYQVFSPGEYKFTLNYIILLQPIYNMLVAPLIFLFGRIVTDSIFEES